MSSNTVNSYSGFLTASNIKFTVNLTEKMGKLTRTIIDLSSQFISLPAGAISMQKGTYFVSVIILPRSLHSLVVSVFEINKVNSLKTGGAYLFVVTQKVSLIVKDSFDILKGMKAFGLLNERYFFVFKALPVLGNIGTVFIVTQLYQDIIARSNCQSALSTYDLKKYLADGKPDAQREVLLNQLKKANVSLAASALNISGMALLVLSPFVLAPVAIPAHLLLTLSAIASVHKVMLFN